MADPAPAPRAPSTTVVWVAGALSLAVAMGIGRFAFTPLLPLMMRDRLLDAPAGAALAAANYLGYLLGALSAARVAADPLRLVRFSLVATAILTVAVGIVDLPPAWIALRLAAGVCSAWTLVGTSTWAIGELARRGESARAARVFSGVGVGIMIAGGQVWLAADSASAALWRQLGIVAAILGLAVLVLLRHAPRHERVAVPSGGGRIRGAAGLIACYGLFGLGYSLPVTFLPAQARALIDDPRWFGLAWPAFGLAAALATALSAPLVARWRARRLWAAGQGAIAIGTALPSIAPGGAAIALSALLVGASFMVVTMVGLQEARALAPQRPAGLLGRMTAAFAVGQMAGPLVVRAIGNRGFAGLDAIDLTALPAAALLGASAVWLWRSDASPPRSAGRGCTDPR
jgi:hypothetical protein